LLEIFAILGCNAYFNSELQQTY